MNTAAPVESIARLETSLAAGGLDTRQRVDLLTQLSTELFDRDGTRGATVAREALLLAREALYPLGEAEALYCVGRNLYALGDYPGVFESQDDALKLFREIRNKDGEGRCLNLLGITHRQLAEYGQALAMYDAALRLFRNAGNLSWQARVISNIGNVEIQLGNHQSALEHFDTALQLRRDAGDYEGAGFDLNNAAFAHIQKALVARRAADTASCQSEAQTAIRLLRRALAIARDARLSRLEATCLQTMSEAYEAMADHDAALGMVDEFLALAKNMNDRWSEAYGLSCVGEIRYRLGEHEASVDLLSTALGIFESLGSRDECARVAGILSESYEAIGNAGEALRHLRTHNALKEALHSEDSERQVRSLAARRRLEHAARETEHFRRLAMEDSLTGLANRRHIDERLEQMLAGAAPGSANGDAATSASGEVTTIALADIDHFKQINDRFSHAAGDEVLRRIGAILNGHCRSGDLAGRYGGEEFLLVFKAFDIGAAARICERVRKAVEAEDWRSIHPELRVTISIGLASNDTVREGAALLDLADRRLYEAKRQGRNRVEAGTG